MEERVKYQYSFYQRSHCIRMLLPQSKRHWCLPCSCMGSIGCRYSTSVKGNKVQRWQKGKRPSLCAPHAVSLFHSRTASRRYWSSRSGKI